MSDINKKVEEVWEKTVDANVNTWNKVVDVNVDGWNKVEDFFVNGKGNLAKHFTKDEEKVSQAKDKK